MFKKMTAAVLASGAAVFGAWPAQAITTGSSVYSKICHEISINPTADGVLAVGVGLIAEGYPPEQAGEAIGTAVTSVCPKYIPAVVEFVNKYGG